MKLNVLRLTKTKQKL